MNNKVNSLSQFIGYYNSDDDDESDNSHDNDEDTDANGKSALDIHNKTIKSTEWTKCFAKDSGHPYYWNTTTREVTWEMPEEYSKYLAHIKNNYNLDNLENNIKNWLECSSEDSNESYYVNKITRSVSWDKPQGWVSPPPTTVAISPASTKTIARPKSKEKLSARAGKPKFRAPEIDEKIELINYYAEKTDSSSDDDEISISNIKTTVISPATTELSQKVILTSQEQPLGGVPSKLSQKIYSLKNDLHPDSLKVSPLNQNFSNTEEIKSILLSAVADAENDEKQSSKHDTTLSADAITTSIGAAGSSANDSDAELFDAKLFKRKKRIEFLPKIKENPPSVATSNNNSNDGIENAVKDHETGSNDKDSMSNVYSNFIKGNVENLESNNDNNCSNNIDKINIDFELKNNIKDLSGIMKDKLKFLSESTTPATSAQVMFIQFDTLMTAYESRNLNEIYLLKWLRETNSTLEKLEKEAVPDDWKCEWDRSSSRYFYENVSTGKKQWDFPVDDIPPTMQVDEKIAIADKHGGANDEMDISTTPPPPAECEINNIPLNEDPSQNGAASSVDFSEDLVPKTPPPPIISENPNDALGSELESFYSDLASIEQVSSNNSNDGTNSTQPQELLQPVLKTKREAPSTESPGPVKKKSKKLKVAGISTKMKDISGMVAKWQKVQRDLSN